MDIQGLLSALGGSGSGGLLSATNNPGDYEKARQREALMALSTGLLSTPNGASFGEGMGAGLNAMRQAGSDFDNQQLRQLLLQSQMQRSMQPKEKVVGNQLLRQKEDGSYEVVHTAPMTSNAPSGFRYTQDGANLEPIPGGPGEQIPGELAARLGLAEKSLGELPGIREDVKRGVATGPIDFMWGKLGQGESGRVMRRISDGTEALQRMLTGAGMNQAEAADYVSRFKPSLTDRPETLQDKLYNLETNLKSVRGAAMRGRGGVPQAPQVPMAADPLGIR